jgi:hypothetical protein
MLKDGSETKAGLFSEMKLPLQRKVGLPGSETPQHTWGRTYSYSVLAY